VLLVYGTGHCLCTVVSDRVTSRLSYVCALAIVIEKRIRSQLERRDANTYLRIAFYSFQPSYNLSVSQTISRSHEGIYTVYQTQWRCESGRSENERV
jgi:hypothetical protein